MSFSISTAAGVFALAGSGTAALVPVVKALSMRLGLCDMPGPRRLNDRPMPNGGGLALYFGFVLSSLLWLPQVDFAGRMLVGAGLILLLGLWDDRYEMSACSKLAGQLLVGLYLYIAGTRIEFVTNPFGGMLYLGWWSLPLTLAWFVAVVNMVNLIDGLDGLAAGTVGIAALALTLIAVRLGRIPAGLVALGLVGAAAGFLPFNFSPAQLFMGDGGAMFLGTVLAVTSVEGALKGPAALAVTVPLLLLGLPTVDMLLAVLRRWRGGVPVFQADRCHLHHRLLDRGWTPRQVVLFFYGVSTFFAALAVWLVGVDRLWGALIGGVAIAIALGLAWSVGLEPTGATRGRGTAVH